MPQPWWEAYEMMITDLNRHFNNDFKCIKMIAIEKTNGRGGFLMTITFFQELLFS